MQHHSKKMNPILGFTEPCNYGKRKCYNILKNSIYHTVPYIVNYRQKQSLSWEENF